MLPNAATVGLAADGGEPWGAPLDPFFEEKVLEEDDRYIIRRRKDGIVVKELKSDPESMPQWVDFPVKTAEDWEAYKKRLDPYSPNRFPEGWDIIGEDTTSFPVKDEMAGRPLTQRDFAAGVMCASLWGDLRYYMGFEPLCDAMYDEVKLVDAMIEWQVYLSCEVLKQIFGAGITPDYAVTFEDMCYNHGSLISPRWVREHMVPGYRKITNLRQGDREGTDSSAGRGLLPLRRSWHSARRAV
jgi:uroporphyrinogen decarboxylase